MQQTDYSQRGDRMQAFSVKRCWQLIFLLPVLALLVSCAGAPPKIIDRPRVVEIKVPTVVPLDSALTADCVPAYQYGEKVTVDDVISRLMAVEDCLAQTRGQLAKIRQ